VFRVDVSRQLLPDSLQDDGLLDVSGIVNAADAGFVPLTATAQRLGRPGVRYVRGTGVTCGRSYGLRLIADAEAAYGHGDNTAVTVSLTRSFQESGNQADTGMVTCSPGPGDCDALSQVICPIPAPDVGSVCASCPMGKRYAYALFRAQSQSPAEQSRQRPARR